MHRGSRSLIAICCVAVCLTGIARAEVVFGNLGASGTATVGSFNADIGSASNPFLLAAQGFIPAAPNLMLQSVGLWLFGDGSVPASVGIFSDSAGFPFTRLYSSNTVNVGAKALYEFTFSGATLSSGSSYWVIPETATEISWYIASSATSEQNASGYTSLGAVQNAGNGFEPSQPFAVSISAVPEPSTCAMALAGLACGGYSMWRRRKRA